MVRRLKRQGVPIDGVGSQAHLSTRYGNYTAFQVQDMLDRFAGLGVATALTEVDVRNLLPEEPTSDAMNPLLQAQAYNYSALMRGCLASRHCLSYTVWGFDDGSQLDQHVGLRQRAGARGDGGRLRRRLPAEAGVPGAAVRPVAGGHHPTGPAASQPLIPGNRLPPRVSRRGVRAT